MLVAGGFTGYVIGDLLAYKVPEAVAQSLASIFSSRTRFGAYLNNNFHLCHTGYCQITKIYDKQCGARLVFVQVTTLDPDRTLVKRHMIG